MGDTGSEVWPLAESKPMSRLQQNSAQLITSATGPSIPNLVEIHSLGASGQMNKIYKNYCYLFIYTFFSLISLQVKTVYGLLRAIAQKTWNHARMCLFGVIKLKFNLEPYLSPKTVKFWPKTGQFLSRIGILTRDIDIANLSVCLSVCP